MIALLNGKLVTKTTDSVIVDVGGVGYEVFIPLSTYYKLPEPESPVTLRTHTYIKDDSIQIYGFLSAEEKEVFQHLLCVSGVGPRLARNILSGISVEDLVTSITRGDLAKVNSIPGVGAKTAQRLVLELKDKLKAMAARSYKALEPDITDTIAGDVVSALINLGYRQPQAESAVKKARTKLGPDLGFEELLKESLKMLSAG